MMASDLDTRLEQFLGVMERVAGSLATCNLCAYPSDFTYRPLRQAQVWLSCPGACMSDFLRLSSDMLDFP